MSSTRILILSNMYPGVRNPTYGVFVKEIEDGLAEQGCEVVGRVVIDRRGRNTLEKLRLYTQFYVQALLRIAGGGFDLVYGHYLSHVALPLLLAKRIFGKRVVVHVHGSDIMKSSGFHTATSWATWRLARCADLVVVTSEYCKRVFLDKFSVAADKVFVSPSGGVDLRLFHPAPSEARPAGQPLQIGYVSRIDRGKGWEVLLEALSLLKGKGIDNFRCQLYGPGGDADMAALRVGIDELKLPGVVEYAGVRPHHELPTVFRLLDIFVFPTTRESLGLVGLEAMACGVPVIGSRIPPLEEYIVDGGNGFLFAPGDAADLADKIEAFMRTSLTTRQEMRQQSVAMAKRYDRETVACAMKARFARM